MTVGFFGAGYVIALSTREEMQSFFELIKRHVVSEWPQENWSLITDRLYRRYVHLEDSDDARALMRIAAERFATLPFDYEDPALADISRENSLIDWDAGTLHEAYNDYFDAFEDVASGIDLSDFWDGIQPVRILIADKPIVYSEMDRPLHIYDDMDGPPLWLVPLSERDDEAEEGES